MQWSLIWYSSNKIYQLYYGKAYLCVLCVLIIAVATHVQTHTSHTHKHHIKYTFDKSAHRSYVYEAYEYLTAAGGLSGYSITLLRLWHVLLRRPVDRNSPY